MDATYIQLLENKVGRKLQKRNRNTFRESGYFLENNQITGINLNRFSIVDIAEIVDILSKFEHLKYLSLSSNRIIDIEAISKIGKLVRLDLSHNKIINIEALENLTELEFLDLNSNNITDIASIQLNTSITYLNLNGNKLENVFYLKNLTSLKYLHLASTKSHNIDFAKNLVNLEELVLSNNNIISINSLENLTKLRTLDLNYNKVEYYSPISNLINLRNLLLIENLPKDIDSLENLINLEVINLSSNELNSIWHLRKMNKLKVLWLYNNRVKDIELIKNFTKLEHLSVGNNTIENVNFLENLHNLVTLKISNNSIKDINLLSGLKKLETLDLSHNKIIDISSLENLKKLITIDLKNNLISELPEWLTKLNLKITYEQFKNPVKCIMLHNNPITVPPIGIVKQGRSSIARYFEKIKIEGLSFIYEAKLILVGEGSAGKTSLQVRLMDDKSVLPKKDTRTRGIDIKDWNFKEEDSRKHIAHIWDFGGQDVYYPVHRFFITENSVFVLLSSTRQSHHNFDYWIPTIYQFGGKSPIIIGQTCHDGNMVPWNDLGVYVGNSNFNIIKTSDVPYYELNLPKHNEGLNTIKQIIIDQIVRLPHYGKGVPKSWTPIRDLLHSISKASPCITFDKFRELCRESSYESFKNLIDVKDCCQFFHDIGVILWYSSSDELKDWVILQPEWAMNAVYKIIDDEIIQKRKGNIIHEDFQRLWNDKHYNDHHVILKKMLEIFKISFPKKHKKEDYIIPARLLSIPVESEWSSDENYLRLEYQYDFMPRGIVNQVSAELSRYILDENEVWNNACNFYLKNNMAECQVVENFYHRKIVVKAKGRDARGIMILIMDALNNITDGYKGVKPAIYVPCICPQCRTSSEPTTFLHSKLLEWLGKRENAKVTCNESDEDLLIEELLYNVGLPNPEEKKKKRIMNKTITIFLASSSELSLEREQFEIFINRENKRLNEVGIFIKVEIWEDFIDALSSSRLQDEYNRAVERSDIFVSLFFRKVGKYTLEEFITAYNKFKKDGRPFIYTYFKNSSINSGEIVKEEILSRLEFEEKLKELGHYPTAYSTIEDLKSKFKSQLDKLIPMLISQ